MADGAAVRRLYKVLGVTSTISDEELKGAYREQVLKWHPDRHTEARARDAAEFKFRELQAAFDDLTKHRKSYPSNSSGAGHSQAHTAYDPLNRRQTEAERAKRSHDVRGGQKAADGWGPWRSSRGSTWSAETGQPERPFEYTNEKSQGFTAPRFVRDARKLEYEKKYSTTEFRVRRLAIAGVILGGAWTLWTAMYGGGTRRRLVTGSRHGAPSMSLPGTGWTQKTPEATGSHSFTPIAGASPVSMAAAASGGVGLASAVVSDGERKHAQMRKADGDVLKAQGDYTGAAAAYREAALSVGVDVSIRSVSH